MKKIDVVMPKMGESITEGRILKWLKQPGDKVEKDETLVEISTDKVDTEVPSPVSGVLVEILVPENEVVEVDTKIARIETEESVADDNGSAEDNTIDRGSVDTDISSLPTVSPAAVHREASGSSAKIAPSTASGRERSRFYSPVVLRIATTEGISMDELASIEGTGINGRVTKKDVLRYLERRAAGDIVPVAAMKRPGAGTSAATQVDVAPQLTFSDGQDIEIIEMDNVRRLIAEHMVRSVHTAPHAAMFSEVDMTLVDRIRERHGEDFKRREGFSLTYLPFVADAVVRAIKDFPLINSSVEGTKILVKRRINLGIATALGDGGLIVPVVKDADSLSLAGLARHIVDLSRRARDKQLKPDEIQGGTFTITNFGVFGNLFGFPIINQPEAAILGIGSVVKRAVVVDMNGSDVIAIRPMMYLSLSIDHRVIDGALGGMFLERVAKYLGEVPASIT